MERKSGHSVKDLNSPPLLSITGKPLQVMFLSEKNSKKRLSSPDLRRILTPVKQSRLERTLQNFMASGKTFVSQKKPLTPLMSTLAKKSLVKANGKNPSAESIELENGAKIYKCMSNPNVNGNSSTLGYPIRSSTALTELSIVYKTPLSNHRRKTTTPKANRLKVLQKKETLSQALQKSNGISVKEEEECIYKYFLGPGNNSELIFKTMKKRPKWKRVYSHIGAHFMWTALKKSSITESLVDFEVKEERNTVLAVSEYPLIMPQDVYCQVIPVNSILPSKAKLYNRLNANKELTSKKRLFFNMHSYYTENRINPFSKIPLTFHVSYGSYDANFKIFVSKFHELQNLGVGNVWIVKPGECTNRGFGIHVCSTLEQIVDSINNYESDNERTFVIQKYIDNPLLYKGRKFDIRCYAMISCIMGNFQCFFYKEGYLRTSSVDYSLKNVSNKYIHLTNDAVQKYSQNYGKHEAGNKLSYAEFHDYLQKTYGDVDFYKEILPQIKDTIKDTALATYMKLDPNRKTHSFEILGYDFLIDTMYKVWLIEVNTNPCLELSSPYLETLIPKMVDNAFCLTVDQIFPGEYMDGSKKDPQSGLLNNEFELIFNEAKYNRDLNLC